MAVAVAKKMLLLLVVVVVVAALPSRGHMIPADAANQQYGSVRVPKQNRDRKTLKDTEQDKTLRLLFSSEKERVGAFEIKHSCTVVDPEKSLLCVLICSFFFSCSLSLFLSLSNQLLKDDAQIT